MRAHEARIESAERGKDSRPDGVGIGRGLNSPAVPQQAALPSTPFLLFRNTELGDHYGKLSAVELPGISRPRIDLGLSCERSYFAGGWGVCLTAERGVFTSYKGFLFDESLRARFNIPLQGIPSRTRVSPDGRYAAVTVFVSGDSYAPGTFSTRTEVFRTADGTRVAELERFSVERDGAPFRAVDFNFWGVTFAKDPGKIYATLATGGNNFLIEGDLPSQHARIIHSAVECPSLSPDNRRVAFKRLAKAGWQIYVMELATGTETPLTEQHSVDDQVEWLDDQHLLYGLGNDVWTMNADGTGTPTIFLRSAYSPAAVR